MNNGHPVNPIKGFSLLETMLSLALSALLLVGVSKWVVTEVSQQRLFGERDVLKRQVSLALDIAGQEVLKAGYNANNGSSLSLSGTDALVAVNESNNAFGFTYLNDDGTGTYRTVSYQQKDQKLVLCEKTTNTLLSLHDALASNKGSPCYSVFDHNTIHVEQFNAEKVTLLDDSGAATLDVLLLTLSLSLASSPRVLLVKNVDIPLRNRR